MSGSALGLAFQLAFEVAPIVLTGGIAGDLPGYLPLIAITEAASFLGGLLQGSSTPSMDKFFAHFSPMPGGTLIDNQIGTYPFANQAVAANAIIAQPLTLSMMMQCPARGDIGGYPTKLITMIALREALHNHCSKGGTFIVVTPSYFYTDMIMTGFRDISSGQTRQHQSAWQMDFVRPLLTVEEAEATQNSLMSKLTSGSSTNGSWSGTSASIGSSSGAATGLVPATSGTPTTSSTA